MTQEKPKRIDLGALQTALEVARKNKAAMARALTAAQNADLRASDALKTAQVEFDAAYHGIRNS